jgi:hypothetical protein
VNSKSMCILTVSLNINSVWNYKERRSLALNRRNRNCDIALSFPMKSNCNLWKVWNVHGVDIGMDLKISKRQKCKNNLNELKATDIIRTPRNLHTICVDFTRLQMKNVRITSNT